MKLPTAEEIFEACSFRYYMKSAASKVWIKGAWWMRDLLQPQIEELEKEVNDLRAQVEMLEIASDIDGK